MKLLANENIPLASIPILRDNGYDIRHIGIDSSGIKDIEVLSLAISEGRTIITFDRDYGELIFKYQLKPKGGIIYLRLENFSPEDPAYILLNLFARKKLFFENRLTVVDKNNIRQRKYV